MLPTSLQTFTLALALVPSLASSAAILPRSRNVTVTSVSTQGTGCPNGTVSTTIKDDNDGTAIAFGFDNFQTFYGPSYLPNQRAKNCVIDLKLSYHPVGDKFEIADATYHGSARLDIGMQGMIASSYRFTSNSAGDGSVQTQAEAAGELVGDYTKTVAIPKGSRIASPCGAEQAGLQISTRVALRSTNVITSGMVEEGSPFSLDAHLVRLRWSICED